VRREKHEGKDEKGSTVSRTKNTRPWDERPRGEVKGNGDEEWRPSF